MATKYVDQAGLTKAFSIIKGWVNGVPQYELPKATGTVLGGVIIGTGLSVDAGGVVSVKSDAVTSVPWSGVTGKVNASKSEFGIVKIGAGIDVNGGVISVTHPDVYTKTEADGKFQTQAQVTALAQAAVAKVVDGAPESLDTLKEIADTLNSETEGGIINGVMKTIGEKANKDEVYTKEAMDTKAAALASAREQEYTTYHIKQADAIKYAQDATSDYQSQIDALKESAEQKYVASSEMVAFTATEVQAIADAI